MGLDSSKSQLRKIINVLKVINNTDALDLNAELGINIRDPRDRQKDLIPFLMDLLSLIIGGQRLEQILTNIIGSQLEELDRKIRDQLRDMLKSKCGEAVLNSGFPAWLNGGGLEISLVNIDIFDLLKGVQGNGGIGSQYANNVLGKADDFNRKIMEAVDNLNTATSITIAGTSIELIKVTYTGGGFIIQIGTDYTNKTVENFIDDYFDNLRLFDPASITTEIVDSITGVFSKKAGKTYQQILEFEEMDMIINRMAGTDCGEIINEESRFYKFSRSDLDLFNFNAQNKSQGTNIVDLQCGTFSVNVSESDATELSTQINKTFSQVFVTERERKEGVTEMINGLSGMIQGGSRSVLTSVSYSQDPTSETIRGDLVKRIIDSLKNTFIKKTLTPQTMIMMLLIGYALVDDSELEDQGLGQPKKIVFGPERINMFKKLQGSMRELVKVLYELVVEVLFKDLATNIKNFMARIALGIIREKLEIWTNSIKATITRGRVKLAGKIKRIF
jgi:hypothetical protein|tara:strand:- start:780 stop:2288 length:1509 start_codon:yes stop_codon:yes gene_type:complete